MVDAVTKPCRFANCAKVIKGLPALPQRINLHYGGAHQQLADRAASGTLGLTNILPARTGSRATAPSELEEHSGCVTQLHCARKSTKGMGGLDEHGLIGATCTHVFPVRGSFCDLYTHEQVCLLPARFVLFEEY
jgi:hypothetical protein